MHTNPRYDLHQGRTKVVNLTAPAAVIAMLAHPFPSSGSRPGPLSRGTMCLHTQQVFHLLVPEGPFNDFFSKDGLGGTSVPPLPPRVTVMDSG